MESKTPGDASPVQEVLESLLSKKNLVRDQFLAGNMNPQMYIPIRILLAHEKLSSISATEDDVIVAAEKSARLGIDEDRKMVRPLLKSKRNVVILRDIPDGTTEEEIRGIFKDPSNPFPDKVKSAKPEVNNTWFVKFDLDEGTQEVVLWLRSQKFKGNTVNAAIKSEHFLRSFFPLNLPTALPGMPPQQSPGHAPPMVYGVGGKGGDPNMFGGDMMGGKGGEMPTWMIGGAFPGPQLPGFWQPWGKRTGVEDYVKVEISDVPLPRPESTEKPEGKPSWYEESKGEKGGKGKGKNDGKVWPSWGGESKGWGGKGWDDGGKGKGGNGWNDGKGQAKGWEPAGKGKGKGEDGKKKWEKKERRPKAGSGDGAEVEEHGPLPEGVKLPAAYKGDFRKYSREEFDQLCKATKVTKAKPDDFKAVDSETFPIFLEEPSETFAEKCASAQEEKDV